MKSQLITPHKISTTNHSNKEEEDAEAENAGTIYACLVGLDENMSIRPSFTANNRNKIRQ